MRHSNAKASGQVVIAAACELKSLRILARCPSARGFDRTDEGEIFKHRGDMSPSKAIVAMSAFRFYQHQATSEKLAQMRAGRLRCYASGKGQFAGRALPSTNIMSMAVRAGSAISAAALAMFGCRFMLRPP
jgi:hypothetical protein